MDFNRKWTPFALEAEFEHFGAGRISRAHNDRVNELEAECARLRKWLHEIVIRESVYDGVEPSPNDGRPQEAKTCADIARLGLGG